MISIIIITKNEEKLIGACLESVKWADEVIVVDGGSTDQTLSIAKKYTTKIITCLDEEFDFRRNKGMDEATGNWVLYIDSDERVLDSLKQEILSLTQTTQKSAFAISRRNVIFGQEVKYGFYQKDWIIRLFRKSEFEKWVGKVHEYAKFKGELGYTKNSLLHLTHRDLDQIVLKSLSWSKIDAKLRFDSNHPKMSGWRFIRILFSELFNQGIRRQGFFNRDVGIMDSILQTFSMFMSYVRLWQMQQPKSLAETYEEIDKKLIAQNFKY